MESRRRMSLSPLLHQMPPRMRRLGAPFQPEFMPEGRAPKDRGLPSPHPGWVIAQGLLQILSAATPKLLWRFFFSCIRAVRPGLASSEQVVAVALRNTLPESLATAAKTSTLVKFTRDRLDLSATEAMSLTARAAQNPGLALDFLGRHGFSCRSLPRNGSLQSSCAAMPCGQPEIAAREP